MNKAVVTWYMVHCGLWQGHTSTASPLGFFYPCLMWTGPVVTGTQTWPEPGLVPGIINKSSCGQVSLGLGWI